jgi:hypothetical protein
MCDPGAIQCTTHQGAKDYVSVISNKYTWFMNQTPFYNVFYIKEIPAVFYVSSLHIFIMAEKSTKVCSVIHEHHMRQYAVIIRKCVY